MKFEIAKNRNISANEKSKGNKRQEIKNKHSAIFLLKHFSIAYFHRSLFGVLYHMPFAIADEKQRVKNTVVIRTLNFPFEKKNKPILSFWTAAAVKKDNRKERIKHAYTQTH